MLVWFNEILVWFFNLNCDVPLVKNQPIYRRNMLCIVRAHVVYNAVKYILFMVQVKQTFVWSIFGNFLSVTN